MYGLIIDIILIKEHLWDENKHTPLDVWVDWPFKSWICQSVRPTELKNVAILNLFKMKLMYRSQI